MTPLLSLLNVRKSYPDGDREILVLDCVSLELDRGVSMGVYGARRSGKSTLLRIAAGIARPDSGTVLFDGRDMARMGSGERGRLLRREIAFMSTADWRAIPGESVLDLLATSLGSAGLTMREARTRSLRMLDEVGLAAGVAEETAGALSLAERARVMLARALARNPRLLLLDEPAVIPHIGDGDRFSELLRASAHARGLALIVASEEMAALRGLGMLVSIADGELVSTREAGQVGTVVRLPGRRRAGSGGRGR